MGLEFGGLLGLLILVLDVWAIIKILQSRASIAVMVLWIVLILVLPLIGFLLWLVFGPRAGR